MKKIFNNSKLGIAVIITLCILIGIAGTCFSVTAMAAETINLNNSAVEFTQLMFVEDGEIYFPIRLAFNMNAGNLMKDGKVEFSSGENPYYSVLVNDFIDEEMINVRIRRKDEAGNMLGDGRYVKIVWDNASKTEAAENYSVAQPCGMLQLISYKFVDGKIDWSSLQVQDKPLNAEIKLVQVDEKGGERLYVSLEDLKLITDFLTDGDDYRVELLPLIQNN